jgi:hypothetical protein
MIRHLNANNFKEMPWANGKGTTVEMLRIEREGQVMLRLSRAMVVEDGAFSVYPGIERNLTVLSGPGFDLVGAGVLLHALPLVPVAFAGDIPIRAEKVTERSEDFNVMTARDLPLPHVSVVQAGLLPGPGAIFALEPGVIAGKAVARYDLVIADHEVDAAVPAIHVRLAGWSGTFWPEA